jgi:hypothetical protein
MRSQLIAAEDILFKALQGLFANRSHAGNAGTKFGVESGNSTRSAISVERQFPLLHQDELQQAFPIQSYF